jgi:hypothetical protein
MQDVDASSSTKIECATLNRVPTFQDLQQGILPICRHCHSAKVSGDARNGAPPDVNFDTYDEFKVYADTASFLVRQHAMPFPKGEGPTDAQRSDLYAWAACGTPEGAGPPNDAGSDAGSDGGSWTFPGMGGLPASPPWGPNLLGLQDHADGGSPADVAFGVFWDPANVWTPYVGQGCIAFGTSPGHPGGRDVGAVTVTGGSGQATVPLTRDANFGSYYVGDPKDPWAIGDLLSATVAGHSSGPVAVPTPFTAESLTAHAPFGRASDATLTFSGSNASKVAFSVSAHAHAQSFLLVCVADAASGKLVVPAAALASFPKDVTSIDGKLSPINLVQDGDLRSLPRGSPPRRASNYTDAHAGSCSLEPPSACVIPSSRASVRATRNNAAAVMSDAYGTGSHSCPRNGPYETSELPMSRRHGIESPGVTNGTTVARTSLANA